MRALESVTQVPQVHLNRRRILPFFTGTLSTGSRCVVQFQSISEPFQPN